MHMFTKGYLDYHIKEAFLSEPKLILARLSEEDIARYQQDLRDHKETKDISIIYTTTEPSNLNEVSNLDKDSEEVSAVEKDNSEENDIIEIDDVLENDGVIEEDNVLEEGGVLEKDGDLEVDGDPKVDDGLEVGGDPEVDDDLEVIHVLEVDDALEVASSTEVVDLLDEADPTKNQKSSEIPRSPAKSRCLEEPSLSEPSPKKIKLNEKKKTGNLKIVFSREGETDKFKSQLLFNNILNIENNPETSKRVSSPIPSTSTSNEIIDITTDEPSSSSSNSVGKIKVRDIRTMMDSSMVKKFNNIFTDKKPRNTANTVKKLIIPNCPPGNVLLPVIRGHLSLGEIENLYNRYFSKGVQDTIVIIANILNIISMSNKHHKARMDESFKKRTEAEKLKERCDANRQHMRHKNVLENKLKMNFLQVILTFEESEFEPTFQMFFLSILTVLRVLDQPKFKKGSIFKNLVLLLWNSLKNSDLEHPKVFTMFRSKCFRPDCIDLISLIEDSRDKDPGVVDRMALFFVSTVNSREYFQAVIDVVTSDSNEDLALLIDNSSFQCRSNSTFTDPINYCSSLKMCVSNKTIYAPASSTITSVNITVPSVITTGTSINATVPSVIATVPSNDKTPQHWLISKAAASTSSYQVPKTNNIIVEQPSQPLNSFYENFSNSLLTRVPSDQNNTTIAPKPKVNVVGTPNVVGTIAHIGQGQATTFVAIKAFKPSCSTSTSTNNTFQRTDGGTIVFNNKQYQLVRAPAGQIRTIPQNVNIFRMPPPLLNTTSKCSKSNCNNNATIMCSTCESVKYCSHDCQRADWYDNHMKACEEIVKNKNQPNNQ